jgi:hypothetical protein
MMSNLLPKIVLKALCVAALASPAAFPADNLAAVFAKMDEAAPKFKGMRADMKKVSHTAVINEDATDTGSIVVKVPKPHDYRMLMKFDQPDKKLVGVEAGGGGGNQDRGLPSKGQRSAGVRRRQGAQGRGGTVPEARVREQLEGAPGRIHGHVWRAGDGGG